MDKRTMNRSEFLRGGFKLLYKHFGKAVESSVLSAGDKFVRPMLRPPGAVEEVKFLLKCTRCDNCMEACPVNAIVKADAGSGSAMGTPVIEPEQQPCRMCEDFPCIQSCPAGALVEQPSYKIGTARIVPTRCLAHNGQICDYCYDCCPQKDNAILLEAGKPIVVERKCTGCGICSFYCPAPGKAVEILPVKQ
ncbi:MAG: 4Fe-4S dicluster domain-containing protein [bacterium]|nr:4Fe-4S dicluster domain-containing protein [bacterium]